MIPLSRITHADECASHRGQSCDCDREKMYHDQPAIAVVAEAFKNELLYGNPFGPVHGPTPRGILG